MRPPDADRFADARTKLLAHLARRGWTPFEFQLNAWNAYLAGHSGLVHAPTGSGKTLAVFGGPLIEGLAHNLTERPKPARAKTSPFTILWLTPLRALANDTTHALTAAALELGLPWSVELRTSDTSSSIRKRQKERLPTVLVTTPESLSLQLSYPDSLERMSTLRCVIVDEWHELMSTKRGVQLELGLSRLRRLNPQLRVWGLSATLGNLQESLDVLMGHDRVATAGESREGMMIHANLAKDLHISTMLPESAERFPWAGHLGIRMVDPVIAELDKPGSALVFCNTRSHTEHWFKSILSRRPEWLGEVAIHHGSLDRKIRLEVEHLLRDGKLRAVVCTSSLDLGVDFSAVDRVIQIGSPKGVGRLMQRAGRSGHRPGEASVAVCVPTHSFELVEFSAARHGIELKLIESRPPLRKPLDVLVQHAVTIAAGGGFDGDALFDEVRSTHAFAELTREEWGWVLDFVARGGPTLTAYPRFARVVLDAASGRWSIAWAHRATAASSVRWKSRSSRG